METKKHLGLTYSATCQVYWVIWDFPVLSPIEISSVSPKKDKLNHQKFGALSAIRSISFGGDSDYYYRLDIISPGGSIIHGFAVYDMMQLVNADVYTLGLGLVASMAALILVGGTITKRIAFPYTWRQWGFYLREKIRLCLRHMKYDILIIG
uniref:ATP-dependent Clp protease proteolytic subunit n=1 Tax=Weigela florida TaxID=79612 RepID=A0A2U8XHA2_WEIFL|nr:ATP-dependent Clp protease proteolytic subunit [Weigela florida]AWN57688.1 ATP-dependent Clp protease proteolytic subunit [Weigela florida]